MLQPGRSYTAGNQYRYGFNGKEQDNEVSGQGNQYDYGFRIYNPRLGRFLSVDPLIRSYPMLTPYQFASNRPIDGVDLDGLEYVSIHHFTNGTNGIKMHYKSTDADIKKIHGTTSGFYNSASYGPQGRGVVHYYYNSDGAIDPEKTRWDQRQTGGNSDLIFHGLYSGPGSITDRNGKYDFSFQPIDWADAIAKRHDKDYDDIQKFDKAGDVKGILFLEDIRTVQADRDMVERIEDYRDFFKDVKGVETPYRKFWSGEMELAMTGQAVVITALATYKQWKIDHKYGNNDTYDKLRAEFKKGNRLAVKLIDKIVKN